MTQDALERLLALAGKATPGPWELEHRTNAYSEIGVYNSTRKRWTRVADVSALSPCVDNASFIAACSPEVVAALVQVAMAAEEYFGDEIAMPDEYTKDMCEHLRALDAALAKEKA